MLDDDKYWKALQGKRTKSTYEQEVSILERMARGDLHEMKM
jgi:hypothetical protein